MKKNILKILSIFCIFFCGLGIFYALSASKIFQNYRFKNNDAICGGKICSNNDSWSGSVDNIFVFNSDRDSYPKGYRGLIQFDNNSIFSYLFGKFTITSQDEGDKGFLLKDIGEQTKKCGAGERSYSVSGAIKSPYFGIMNIQEDLSFFCPANTKSVIVFDSDLLDKKIIATLGIEEDEEEELEKHIVENAQLVDIAGKNGDIIANVFEKQQIAILGKSKIVGSLEGIYSESGDRGINSVDVFNGTKFYTRSSINKNIADLTKNVVAKTGNFLESISSGSPSFSFKGEKIFYYDFRGQADAFETYGNKGKILTFGKTINFSNIANSIITVEGKNTLILKGGNLYIRADIANKNDKDSLLSIVVLRDENNQGGNIYIDPDVTNIDAVLVAEGSVLSFKKDSTILYTPGKILNRANTDDQDILGRQLYIYGSVYSKNVIGTEKIPYGSDKDLLGDGNDFSSKDENIYNFANLRGFQPRYGNVGGFISDCEGKEYWTAGTSSSIDDKLKGVKQFAWAGKMRCFNKKINPEMSSLYDIVSNPVGNLRSIGRSNSVIFHYNPNIQTNSSYILLQ